MTKPATHTVPGAVGTRKSPRVYTHATVVAHDPVWIEKHQLPQALKHALHNVKGNYAYLVKRSQETPTRPWELASIESAQMIVAKYPTALDYAQSITDETIARVLGDNRVYDYVLSWHQSEAAAVKFCSATNNKCWYGPARVAAVVRS